MKEHLLDKQIILSSASPRRKELILDIDPSVRFLTIPVDETLPDYLKPDQAVQVLAEKKARTVYESLTKHAREGAVVIGADTIVSIDQKILGKPKDEEEAKAMLNALSGRTHQVYTGVSIIYDEGREINFVEKTDVTFRNLSDDEMNAYIKTGDPMDKAGAYGIQGEAGKFVVSYQGDFNNVVGLPVRRLERMLRTIEH